MKAFALAAGLLVLGLAVFAQVREFEFLAYDDRVYVVENPLLRDGPTPAAIAQAFREPYEANWIPLTWVSLQVDHALFGLDPAGYHAMNLALHLAATLALFFALRRMTRDALPSAFVAAVFAIHPLHVESVAWVAERKDVLSGLGFALTLYAWARYAEKPGIARYGGAGLAFAACLLAKPMGVTLPFVLLLLDFWPLRRLRGGGDFWRLALEKAPLLLLSALAAVVTLHAQRTYGALDQGDALPFAVRLPNALLAYAAYLRDAFWPAHHAVFYPHPEASVSWPRALAAGALLLVLSGGAWRLRGRHPCLLVGWLWFVGMLVPVIGFVQAGMQARADRYTYLPLIGLALAIAWTAQALVASRGAAARRGLAGLGVAAVGALAFVAHAQTAHWRDTERLFTHATQVTRDNFLAHQWVGSEQLRRGDLAGAERSFAAAQRIKPQWADAQRGLADVQAERGEWDAAIRGYERALRLTPRDARGHLRLARALAASGRDSEALGRARHAVRIASGASRSEALVVLGAILSKRGQPADALAAYDAVLATRPDLAEAQVGRGLALQQLGRRDEAREALSRAAKLATAAADERLAAEIHRLLEGAGAP